MSEVIDNRANRIRTLKSIIKRLHEGAAPEEVKGQLTELVRQTDSSEIAAMEQSLLEEGMSVEQIRSMCDLHAQVVRDVMTPPALDALPAGHPAETFHRENEAIRSAIGEMREVPGELAMLSEADPVEDLLVQWRVAFNDLMDIEKHYQRKEHLLFSYLERYGITGPSQVMWAKDDEVRALLKRVAEGLHRRGQAVADWQRFSVDVAEPALRAAEEMIHKEEMILLPLALQTLTEDEWGQIHRQSPQYGWCLVEPGREYHPPDVMEASETVLVPQSQAMVLPSGSLTSEQLLGLFATLPVDITFVDADDRVRFFSEGPDRVFARSRAIIGRKVQHCHPPKSVDVVERILADFRAGRQNTAEFWINFQGKFVHIRYFAMRGEDGSYQGTLEVTQDLTRLRKLEGERRLLQYDEPAG